MNNSNKAKIIEEKKPKKPHVLMALIIASFLMFAFGFGYRVLSPRLDIYTSSFAISPDALKEFPLQIGDWTGIEVPIEEKIILATNTDAHISRSYSRPGDLQPVRFYVAFGVNARDLFPHRPEVCYIGAGWTLEKSFSKELKRKDGKNLPVTIYQFKRGVLNNERVILLDYYIVDGEYCRDVSLLRWRAWKGSGTIGYVAQVQIAASVSVNTNSDYEEKLICDFALDSVSYLSEILNGNAKTKLSEDSNNIAGE